MRKSRGLIFGIILGVIIMLIAVVSCSMLSENDYNIDVDLNQKCKYVVFFNRYNKNGSNRKDLVYYYNENSDLIYRENFDAVDKVPNQIMINNKIYSYGYGGIYETDIITKKTTAINTETPINIVKYDNLGNIYTYQNYGFENGTKGKYISKILKNNQEYIQIDYPVLDFCVNDNFLYVTIYNDIYMKSGKICIYENEKQIKEYDVDLSNGEGKWAIHNNNIFFLNAKSAFKIENKEMKEVYFEGINQRIVMPIVVNNMDFSKLYINSTEVQYKENKLFFTDSKGIDMSNYNTKTDQILDCDFNREEQTFKLKDKLIKINNKSKYTYILLNAFEI